MEEILDTARVEGGAFRNEFGKWVNAHGDPLTEAQIAIATGKKGAAAKAAQPAASEPAQPTEPAQPSEPAEPPAVQLERLNKEALIAHVTAKGFTPEADATKAQIIAAFNAAQAQ